MHNEPLLYDNDCKQFQEKLEFQQFIFNKKSLESVRPKIKLFFCADNKKIVS
jgi:hypothetical protein